ncbi:FkbM family methyltransferase [bacterium]|nr:FkbM family methyltransferase [bacterium]
MESSKTMKQLFEHTFNSEDGSYKLYFTEYFHKAYNYPFVMNEIYNYRQMKNYMKRFDKSSIFVDIGANSGLSAVPIACLGYKVIAFEPVDVNCEALKKACETNNVSIDVRQCALSNRNEISKICVPYAEDNTSLNEAVAVSNLQNKDFSMQDVELCTFDSCVNIADFEKIKFVKIDVQGFEYPVLLGMNSFLEQTKNCSILIEWDDKHTSSAGFSLNDIHNFLTSKGFTQQSWDQGDRLYAK